MPPFIPVPGPDLQAEKIPKARDRDFRRLTYMKQSFGFDDEVHEKRTYMSEDDEQRQLIQWCKTDPRLQFLFHIPNENTAGIKWGIRNRQLGVKSGVPDLFLPIPAGKYHGLFVEMKTKIGSLSENQKKWLSALDAFGYMTVVAHGWEDARCRILDYLNLLSS